MRIKNIIAAILVTVLLASASPALASSKTRKPTKAEIAEFNELWKDDAYKTHSSKKKSKKKSSKKKSSKKDIEVYACDDDEYKVKYDKKKRRATIYVQAFGDWIKIGTGRLYTK